MYMKLLAGAVSALVLASAANAQVAVSVYTGSTGASTAAANATLAQVGPGGALFGATPSATTTVSGINFDSRTSGYTIGSFLNGATLSNPALATADLNNTYMLMTGQIYLPAGNNTFTITHDDGLQLAITGIGTVVNAPGATAPTDTTFIATAPAAGLYNFQLSYGETSGPPAVLKWFFAGAPVGGVPEPATWAMMLLGFAGIGLTMRSRRGSEIAQAA